MDRDIDLDMYSICIYIYYIWVNCDISLTWIEATDLLLVTMVPVIPAIPGSGCGEAGAKFHHMNLLIDPPEIIV